MKHIDLELAQEGFEFTGLYAMLEASEGDNPDPLDDVKKWPTMKETEKAIAAWKAKKDILQKEIQQLIDDHKKSKKNSKIRYFKKEK